MAVWVAVEIWSGEKYLLVSSFGSRSAAAEQTETSPNTISIGDEPVGAAGRGSAGEDREQCQGEKCADVGAALSLREADEGEQSQGEERGEDGVGGAVEWVTVNGTGGVAQLEGVSEDLAQARGERDGGDLEAATIVRRERRVAGDSDLPPEISTNVSWSLS
jgi:hypothetical protein